jgi:sulfofructose kinase
MTGRVNCVGVAVLDLIYTVDRFPAADAKILAHDLREVGGGLAANAAVAVVRLGGQAAWFGRLGADERGRRILDGLTAEGVAVGAVRLVDDMVSSHSIVLVDAEGRRLVVLYRPTALPAAPEWLDLDQVLDCDVVLADIRWPEAAGHVLAAARQRGLPGVLDADTADPASFAIPIAAASHAIFSRDGLSAAAGTEDVEEGLRCMARRTEAFVAVTLGADGVAWLQGGRLCGMAAHRVGVRDTLAAGDVFHGAFALALSEGRDEAAALAFANAAAAVKCSRPGGRDGIPSRAMVERLLATASAGTV